MRDIKFQFLYTDGDDWMRRTFNLDEIMNGEPFDVISDSPLLRNYKMVAKRQYTGLKDCEGTGIYEGDLIQLLKPKSKDFALVEFVNAYVGGWVLTHKDADSVLSLGARNPAELKVIGNIHTTPELIK